LIKYYELFTGFLTVTIIFATQYSGMELNQQEYHEELQKVQDRDFTHSWVSSSAFLFYLQLVCGLLLVIGACIALYAHHYQGKPNVTIPESTLYTPKYK